MTASARRMVLERFGIDCMKILLVGDDFIARVETAVEATVKSG
jgi:hypothetical protein